MVFKRLPLRTILVVPFVLQIFGAVGLVGYLSFRNGQAAVNDLASRLRNELTERIQAQIRNYVETPFLINEINAIALARSEIQVREVQGTYLFWQQAKTFPTTNLIYCGTEDGSFMGVGRSNLNREIVLQVANEETANVFHYSGISAYGDPLTVQEVGDRPFDPRIRPWYEVAKTTGVASWSEIYLDFDALVPVITASVPVYAPNSNELLGVCATDFLLSAELDTFLNELQVGKSGETFIMERTGELVSSSTSQEEEVLDEQDTELTRLMATQSQNPLVRNAAAELLARFGSFEQVQELQQLEFRLEDGSRQFVQVSPFEDGRGLDWLVVVVIPEADFMEQIHANNRTTILLCLLALGIATAIGYLTSRLIVAPISKLNRAAGAIANGDLNQSVEVEGVAELKALAQSFNCMAHQLQESFDTLEHRVRERTSELAESNHQLEQAKDRAEVANRAKSTFIANMSHELRSPLNAVLGFSQLMIRSGCLPPDQQENASIIHRSGEYLLTLINNILDLSKIEAGKVVFTPRAFDLHQLLNDLEDMLYLQAESKGLTFVFEQTGSIPRYVSTDDVKLRQVLINLLSNAIKFTYSGRVVLRVWADSPPLNEPDPIDPPVTTIQFEVEDTGMGIAPEELPTLFEAFTQTQSGRELQEGTGLGLSISRKFIQLMGGDISVKSQPGQGTTFIFKIQAVVMDTPTDEPLHPNRRVMALAPGQPRYRILVVDDKPINRQLLIKLLSPLGFEMKEAANGQEAIALWDQWEPHLIWMDMRMPVMDGYEATKRIKTTTKGQATAVIALTASVLEEEKAVILSAGCDDFIRKPFRDEALFDAIAKHLGVQFIYAEINPSNKASLDDSIELAPEHLATLPKAWLEDLYDAALEANVRRVIEQLETTPNLDPWIYQKLHHWVEQFQFDQIVHLLEPILYAQDMHS